MCMVLILILILATMILALHNDLEPSIGRNTVRTWQRLKLGKGCGAPVPAVAKLLPAQVLKKF